MGAHFCLQRHRLPFRHPSLLNLPRLLQPPLSRLHPQPSFLQISRLLQPLSCLRPQLLPQYLRLEVSTQTLPLELALESAWECLCRLYCLGLFTTYYVVVATVIISRQEWQQQTAQARLLGTFCRRQLHTKEILRQVCPLTLPVPLFATAISHLLLLVTGPSSDGKAKPSLFSSEGDESGSDQLMLLKAQEDHMLDGVITPSSQEVCN